MNRIIRWYNKNRKIFLIAIAIIVLAISVPRALNQYIKSTKDVSSSDKNTTTYNAIQKPAITGETISESISRETVNIIDSFMDYCNSNNVEAAYNLLSEDCKIELYPNIDKFKNNYYNKIFTENRLYDLETWIADENSIIYRITILDDILATGKTGELNIEDYYTIVKENNEFKLNISSYIGKQELNINEFKENLDISILEKHVYMEYEIYNIKVFNTSDKKIMLDSKQNTRNINIVDQNGAKYVAFLNELSESELSILPGMSKDIKIKFNKSYNPKYKEKYLEFMDITDEENNKIEIKVEL